jgi:hypothetical protein
MSHCRMRLQSTWGTAVGRISRPALAALTRRAEGKQQAKLCSCLQRSTQASTAPAHTAAQHSTAAPLTAPATASNPGALSRAAVPLVSRPARRPLAPPQSCLCPNCPQPPRYFLAVIRLCSSIYSSFCHPAPEPQPSPCLINH